MQESSYYSTFERKVTEVFEILEIDPKRALKVIQKEIETRGKKLQQQNFMLNLRMVRAMVLDRNSRLEEAREEIMDVMA